MVIVNTKGLPLSSSQERAKRLFDLVFSIIGLLLAGWIIVAAWYWPLLILGLMDFLFRVVLGGMVERLMLLKLKQCDL